ncbi:hypothetical protein [Candidatus Poriferisocius sp.]|uniref:hypothetical protein n=1 Tax=Candidatus Poriferisocius sp. TaxID=3101276 RepID=UPI003B019CBE
MALDWSELQLLQAVATSKDFWDEVDSLEEAMPEKGETRGRLREHTVADWLFASKAADIYGSVR